MSTMSSTENNPIKSPAMPKHTVQTERVIEQVDIKGQYIQLAAPIQLSGQINIAELIAQYSLSLENLQPATLQIGVDEAGRGPLLGSVTVAAAILPAAWSGLIENEPLKNTPLSILTDSKQLSEKKRDILYPLVQQHAVAHIVADIPPAVIDQVNILQATMLGMRLCTEILLEVVAKYLDEEQKARFEILIDGNRCPDLDYVSIAKYGIQEPAIDCQAWVKGDGRHTSIAAASILAKVSRDKTMYALDAEHPEYGIAKHKGYPTRAHMEAIAAHGVLAAHRRSFAPVRKVLES
ncbi:MULTISPECIES: ribonuclease HII [Psychrobacter]|uniref:ribonuclease HII n=2 Tax=Moraxellaceae TaxID=468 RepID=UPI0007F47CC2|nr:MULTISPECIES: ribonuclease HII [Psychrobacter]OAP71902.1 ribonuclease HII [Psychrobacter sp. SHUES1]WLW67386.1 ribonuclease HII [Psychrobacter sp. van23A]